MGYLKQMEADLYSSENVPVFHQVMIPWIVLTLLEHGNPKVLDIGSGHGHGLIPLFNANVRNLHAVDVDTFKFDFFSSLGIKSYQKNINTESLPFEDNSFDVILCMHVIEHLQDPSNLLYECKRVLKKNGSLVLVTPDWRKQYITFWRDPTHVHPFDKESLRRILEMYNITPVCIKSWGARFGLGKFNLFKIFKQTAFIGKDIIAIGKKN